MADEDIPDPTTPPNRRGQAAQQMAGWLDVANLNKASTWVENTAYNIAVNVIGFVLRYAAKIGALFGSVLADAESTAQPDFNKLASVAVQDLFGVPANVSAGAGGREGRRGAANAVGEMLFNAFSGAAAGGNAANGELQPSDVAAKNFLATMTQLSLEGWLEGWIAEALTLGQLETFGELDDKISHTLGLGRAAAAVHGPLVRHLIVTPLDWKLLKEHTPTLLSASACARQIARGVGDKEKWLEDLRRQGYSADRIEAILNEQRRMFSPADVRVFTYREYWDRDRGLKHLRDQGYDEQGATDALRLEGLRRIDELETQEASAIIAAYVNGNIDRPTMLSMLGVSVSIQTERTLLTEMAEVRRACAVRPLTPAEAKAAVKDGVLNMIDYRRALARDGRDEDAIGVLELMLRKEMDDQADIARLRAQQAADRAAEKAERDAAKANKLAEVEAARALARRGAESDLEAAAVRGLIPLGRVAEVYTAKYDADTVQILLDDLTDRRAAYVAQLAAAEAARKRAAVRNVDVGALEQAVLTHVLSLDEFRRRLEDLHFAADDADLLTATLRARIDALEAAHAARDEAAAAARVKHIDLGRLETLVRRGHRTLRDYAALLEQLGYDEAARAAMTELLQLRIDDDAAAARLRADTAAQLARKGLSLDQLRRAIVLDLRPIADYSAFLLAQGYSVPDIGTLVAELQFDVDEAAAARQRRTDADRRSQAGRAPLSDVRRAARLGLVPVDVYYARLRADGYTDDDVAIESDLLSTEIAAVAAQQAAADAAAAATPAKGLTLAQLAAAVAAGEAPIADYQARALAIGLSADDADTLTRTLADQLAVTAAARDRQTVLAAQGADRELARADLEKAVRGGLLSLDDYRARLQAAGYTDDDAALLTAVLAAAIGAGADDTGGA